MNAGEVANRVSRTFGDEAGVQINDEDIIRWINDAQQQIVIENPGLMEATGAADSVVGQKQYTLPADFALLRSLSYKGFHLSALSFNDFNQFIDGYQAPSSVNQYAQGTPEVYTVWNNEVWLFPVPNTSEVGAINVYYIRNPVAVTTVADDLGVPLQYHNAVVKYVLAQAYELDENYDAKQMKESEFATDTQKLNDRNKAVSQEVYPSVTVLAEDQNYGSFGLWGGY